LHGEQKCTVECLLTNVLEVRLPLILFYCVVVTLQNYDFAFKLSKKMKAESTQFMPWFGVIPAHLTELSSPAFRGLCQVNFISK
jgi:hypothetical protein